MDFHNKVLSRKRKLTLPKNNVKDQTKFTSLIKKEDDETGNKDRKKPKLKKYNKSWMIKLHRGRKKICLYYLEAFTTEEILKFHINNYFKFNGKQIIKMPKKVNMLDLKIMREKNITTYADFEIM